MLFAAQLLFQFAVKFLPIYFPAANFFHFLFEVVGDFAPKFVLNYLKKNFVVFLILLFIAEWLLF